MTHFMVAVQAESYSDLENKMLPFHEYECTGIKKYLQWVGMSDSKMREEYEKDKARSEVWDYEDIADYAQGWHGYKYNPNSVGSEWGRFTNPNRHWDWWVVGGRWSKDFPFNPANPAQVREMRLMQTAKILLEKEKFDAAVACVLSGECTHPSMNRQSEIEASAAKWFKRNEKANDFYQGNTYKFFVDDVAFHMIEYTLWNIDDAVLFHMSPKEFELALNAGPLVQAYIDDGQWVEYGDVGWWGLTEKSDNDFPAKFWSWVKSAKLPIYFVDCHI